MYLISLGILIGICMYRLVGFVLDYLFDTNDYGCSCEAECDCECSCDEDVDDFAAQSWPGTASEAHAAPDSKLVHQSGATGLTVSELDAPPAAAMASMSAMRTTPVWAKTFVPYAVPASVVLSVVVLCFS